MNALTPQQIHAVAMLAKDASKVRDQLKPGDYELDFGIQVSGTLHISHDQMYLANRAPSTLHVLAAVLETYGPKKRQAIAESITVELVQSIAQESIQLAQDLLHRLTDKEEATRRGSVSGKFDVAVID